MFVASFFAVASFSAVGDFSCDTSPDFTFTDDEQTEINEKQREKKECRARGGAGERAHISWMELGAHLPMAGHTAAEQRPGENQGGVHAVQKAHTCRGLWFLILA